MFWSFKTHAKFNFYQIFDSYDLCLPLWKMTSTKSLLVDIICAKTKNWIPYQIEGFYAMLILLTPTIGKLFPSKPLVIN